MPKAETLSTAPIVDVLLVYTHLAAETILDVGIHAEASIALMNYAFRNHRLDERVRLVGTSTETYWETLDSKTELDRVRIPNDGYLDGVHSTREAMGADLVALITEDLGDSCGRARVITPNTDDPFASAFSVTDIDCIANHTLSHELGHNMGLAHDRANANVDGFSAFSYGQQRPAQWYRTIMAYSCDHVDCVRVPFFSDPETELGGIATGEQWLSPMASDNVRALRGTLRRREWLLPAKQPPPRANAVADCWSRH